MTSDKIFINALIASIILHIFILAPLPRIKAAKKIKMPEETEFNYHPEKKIPIDSKLIAEKPTEKPIAQAQAEIPKEEKGSIKQKSKSTADIQPQEKVTPSTRSENEAVLINPDTSDTPMLIADDKKDFSSEPIYLDYYNAVRSQIYKSAQANKPYYFMEGGVTLVFTLSRTGRLLNAGVVLEKSTKNPILQQHALSSIQRAEPFSPFHESMKEQQLTLRITISFEK
jgi:TonB family protein